MDITLTLTGNFITEQTGTTGTTLLLDIPTLMGSTETFVTISTLLLSIIPLTVYTVIGQTVLEK
jgi:hypothetical protein